MAMKKQWRVCFLNPLMKLEIIIVTNIIYDTLEDAEFVVEKLITERQNDYTGAYFIIPQYTKA